MMGPLISSSQLQKSIDILADRRATGLTVEAGGDRLTGTSALDGFDFGQGYFFPPTVVSGEGVVGSRLWREEVFGPVICVAKFGKEEDAVVLANDCDFGLGGELLPLCTPDVLLRARPAHDPSLPSRDLDFERSAWGQSGGCSRLGRDLDQQVSVSMTRPRLEADHEAFSSAARSHHRNDASSPWGGFKDSGIGRENGVAAFHAYTQTKSVIMNTASEESTRATDDWFSETKLEDVRYG